VSAHILLSGKLISEPAVRETKSGSLMANALIAVHVESRSEELEGSQVFSLVAFGDAAEALRLHRKLDQVAATGVMQISLWQGEKRFGILVDSIESARTSRERARQRRSDAQRSEG
jgi:single-stranded DNA-binding protein